MKKVALIGYPLGHSISPTMHNAAYQALNLDYDYSLYPIKPEDFKNPNRELETILYLSSEYAGFNVTIPYKELIIPCLDDIDVLAHKIGAVNTVKVEDGKLVGYNTDGPGFIESLKDEGNFNPTGKRSLILGAGGAGKAIAVMLRENNPSELLIYDAVKAKAEHLAGIVKGKAISKIGNEIENVDLLVNCSPIGMSPDSEAMPIPDNIKFSSKTTVYDLVYNPFETKLLKKAKAEGATAVSGLGMLIRQGALAFKIFTGVEAPYDVMKRAAYQALKINN